MNPRELRSAAQLSPIRLNAAGAQDALGHCFAPVSLLIDARGAGSRPLLTAIGSPQDIDRDTRSREVPIFDLPRTILLPAFVNAHTHLDLTHLGPRPHDPGRGFTPWVDMIRTERATDDDAVRASVRRGIELSLAAGVVSVGDIAGALRTTPPTARASLTPWRTMLELGMSGVSFVEFFAIGTGRDRFKQWLPALLETVGGPALRAGSGWSARIGLQPHAPNTVCLAAYQWACQQAATRSLPLCTHLAESPEERQFVARAQGPMRELLERLGLWDESIAAEMGRGLSPVEHLAPTLAHAAPILAHVNDASDADIALLAQSRATVAYCPRASEYFGAERTFGPHRYRDMLAAGINVALGTDSIVNLSAAAALTPADGGTGMSILEEMRLLRKRDRADPVTLLRMGTVSGAGALNLNEEAFAFSVGTRLAGVVGVDCASGKEHSRTNLVQVVLDCSCPSYLLLG